MDKSGGTTNYQAPMMETASMQVYVGDFVNFSHSSLGIICAKVQRFYMKVIIFCYAFNLY